MKMRGKAAFITGSGSGIGRSIALRFAEEGARVAVVEVSVEGGEQTVSMIKEAGGEAIFVRGDISKASEVESAVNRVIDAWGKIDCAVNNAGIEAQPMPTADCPEEDWDMVIGVNLKGTWLCLKYEIKQMLKQGGGVIVNTSSIAGLVGVQGMPAYTASKHGVIGLTKTAALEYGGSGIRVNAVCPGAVRTPMMEQVIKAMPELGEDMNANHPLGRIAEPVDIAEAVMWLCSDSASFVTGHSMVVDGGYTAK